MGQIVTITNRKKQPSVKSIGFSHGLLFLSLFCVICTMSFTAFFFAREHTTRAGELPIHNVSLHVSSDHFIIEHPTYTKLIQCGHPFDFVPEPYAPNLVFVGWSEHWDYFIEFEKYTPVTTDLVLYAFWTRAGGGGQLTLKLFCL